MTLFLHGTFLCLVPYTSDSFAGSLLPTFKTLVYVPANIDVI
jgi:hypothetical protein